MEQPKISIIVPVYKAENYLADCVDSLLAQTFQDYEILLVNDGSPDRSGDICDEYAKKDKRVKVIHKENGGVSSARQCGLDNAIGEYIIHADPDDWVESDMLFELYKKAKEEKAEMVICDFYSENGSITVYEKQEPSALNHDIVLKELFQQLHGSCWNKLVKRSCFSKYNISFPLELSFCEDHYINAALLKNDISVAYLPGAFYHYVSGINPNSIIRHYTRQTYVYDVMLLEKFQLLLGDSNCLDIAKANFSYLLVQRAFFGNIFDSSEFRERCYSYRYSVFHRGKNSIIPWLMYFSCLGYYKIAYQIFSFFKWCRKKMRKYSQK